jgi:hypothetical protein
MCNLYGRRRGETKRTSAGRAFTEGAGERADDVRSQRRGRENCGFFQFNSLLHITQCTQNFRKKILL